MGKTTAYDASVLKLLFNATAIANIADNAGTSPASNLFVSLHTADPGVGGGQATNECTYTGYTRGTVARSSSGWTITNGTCVPNATISFGACTAGTNTISYFGIGVNGTAGQAGTLYYSGTVTPNIVAQPGVTPQLTTASTITEA